MTSIASHADTMDDVYRVQRYIYDVTRRYYLFGRDQMLEHLAPPPHGSVLEIGCGTARNLIKAHSYWTDAHYYGLDISREMLKTAEQSKMRHAPNANMTLAQGDATKFDGSEIFGINTFDRIFASYVVSMIPDWELAVDRAARQLAPNGELHVVDFGTMDRLGALPRQAMLAWLGKFHVTPRNNLQDVLIQIALDHGLKLRFWQGRLGYAAHAILSR